MRNVSMENPDTWAAFEILKDYLMYNFDDVKLAAGGKEVVKRCHYCGDSRDVNSKHLYIGLNDKGVISYNCFKCNAGGPVLYRFFREIGIFDVDLISTVVQANMRALNNPYITTRDHQKEFYRAPVKIFPAMDKRAEKKIGYINNRLGTQLTIEDMARLKIVLNLKEYLGHNNVRYYSRHPNIIDELDLGFLGFLSIDSSHIVLRRLVPEEKVNPSIRERYNIYNIYSKQTGGVTYYAIPGTIDRSKPCNVIMAEGPFDILSVYLNLPRYDNAIYVSATGKTNYHSLLQYLLLDVKIPYFGTTVHIFSDNDINNRDLNNLYNLVYQLQLPCFLHFNLMEGEKDYGVSGDRIIDSVTEFYRPMI